MADGDYWEDLELAQNYRDGTLKFVRSCLGLDGSVEALPTGNAVIDSFDIIGEALQKYCSMGVSCPECGSNLF